MQRIRTKERDNKRKRMNRRRKRKKEIGKISTSQIAMDCASEVKRDNF